MIDLESNNDFFGICYLYLDSQSVKKIEVIHDKYGPICQACFTQKQLKKILYAPPSPATFHTNIMALGLRISFLQLFY